MKKPWVIISAGGYDTVCYRNIITGEILIVPGIKQIWKYGKFRLSWWIRFLFYLLEIK